MIEPAYLTVEEYAATTDIEGVENLEAEAAPILDSASRAIDGLTGRFFYRTGEDTNGEARIYTPSKRTRIGPTDLLDDIVGVHALETDDANDGTYTTMWEPEDFMLDPPNNPLRGWPYEQIISRGRLAFPIADQSVRVTGSFGWAAVPQGIVDATSILTARILKIKREAPLDIVMTTGGMDGFAIRIAKSMPTVTALIARYQKRPATS